MKINSQKCVYFQNSGQKQPIAKRFKTSYLLSRTFLIQGVKTYTVTTYQQHSKLVLFIISIKTKAATGHKIRQIASIYVHWRVLNQKKNPNSCLTHTILLLLCCLLDIKRSHLVLTGGQSTITSSSLSGEESMKPLHNREKYFLNRNI